MTSITYYVALPFEASEEGDLVAGEPVECQSEHSARNTARRLAETSAGSIAFSRTGDPSAGDFDPAKIIDRFGNTPSEVD